MKTFFIKTFGCQMNEADSEKIAGWYLSHGWQPARSMDEADEIIINTCSVRESAEHRVLGLINNLKFPKTPKLPKVILTGCMLYHGITTLKKKIPQVSEFKPIDEFRTYPLPAIRHPPSGLVPIMEGCNNFCSYCVVPYSRGREKSRPFEEIVCEVQNLTKRGVKEITLLGQNVNSYGKDFPKAELERPKSIYDISIYHIRTPFALLLRVLQTIRGLEKISFLTSNPWDFTDDIIEAIKLPKIDRSLHLPVQSGDDQILRKMNRHYTAKNYLNLVKKIRQAIPEIKIGTDIIVGFPGETDEQFQHTVNLCKQVGFVKAYLGKYSPRPRTAAYKLKDDVPPEEKKRRWRILEGLINKKN